MRRRQKLQSETKTRLVPATNYAVLSCSDHTGLQFSSRVEPLYPHHSVFAISFANGQN